MIPHSRLVGLHTLKGGLQILARLFRRNTTKDESYKLLQRSYGSKLPNGDRLEVWTEVKSLDGAFIGKLEEEDNEEGEYDQVEMYGFFMPIGIEITTEFRIRHYVGKEFSDYDILECDPRAIRRGKIVFTGVKLRIVC